MESIGYQRTQLCARLNEQNAGEEVQLCGWVQRTRNLGALIFVWLRDYSGLVQLVFDQNTCGEQTFAVGEALRSEYVLSVRGQVRLRAAEAVNEKLDTGRIEVFVTAANLLNRAETPPIYIDDDHPEENESVRLKYRYLDIRKPSLQHMLRTRHKMMQCIRNHMDAQGFVEVETPILTKSTPEGARDYLVPARVKPGTFYALPQSPQIYKQLLMLGGYDRYFQLARCFRDEDSRADRQPEFTQCDLEMSFVQPEDVQRVVEGLVAQLFSAIRGVKVDLPLPRMTWRQAMERYGSDKPDRRFGLELNDVSGWAKDCGFGVFEGAVKDGGSVRGVRVPGGAARFSRKEIDALGELVKGFKAKGLAWMTLTEAGVKSPFLKFLSEEKQAALLARMEAKAGDALFFVADRDAVVFQALGQLRMAIGQKLGLIDTELVDLFWVTEFPLLEYDEEEGRFVAMHHPFTSPMDEDLPYLESDPGRVRAKAYDLVLNGMEMGSGSIRIHSSEMQARMFRAIGFTQEEAWDRFGFLLEAFKYGVPPHGGFGMGVDRLLLQLTGAQSLRDVIAFPKASNGSCLMMETPSRVQADQLDLLGLKLTNEEE